MVDWDLRNVALTRERLAALRPRAVVHLAAAPRTADPWAALTDDLRMAESLMRAIAEYGPHIPMLVAGSAAQYGMGMPRPLTEQDPTEPVSTYGAVKCVLERALTAQPLHHGARVIWTRSFNHIGPGQKLDAPLVQWVGQVVDAESAGAGVLRTGALQVVRDFLDVRDVADAYLALIDSDAEGVVNVASGIGVSLDALVGLLFREARVPMRLAHDPTLDRAIDPPHVVGDPTRLRALTAWEPRIGLAQSVRDVLEQRRTTSTAASWSAGAGASR